MKSGMKNWVKMSQNQTFKPCGELMFWRAFVILGKKLLYKRRLTFKRSGGYEQPERKNVL